MIRVSGIKRLLAPLASGALTTEDHGDRIETATFGAISRFMTGHRLAQEVLTVTPTRIRTRYAVMQPGRVYQP